MAKKPPIIIDNQGDKTVLGSMQVLLPNLAQMDVPTVFLTLAHQTNTSCPFLAELSGLLRGTVSFVDGSSANCD